MAAVSPRLVMLGCAPGTRSSMGAVVDAYREHGLLRRWSIDYLATHGAGGLAHNAGLAQAALRRFVAMLARERSLVVHLHAAAGPALWREVGFMGLALAARRPVILQLHGPGFERLHERAGPGGRRALRFLLERAACVVVPCASLRGWVAGVAPFARVEFLASPVASAGLPQQGARANIVLFLSPLEAASGVFDLVAAVARVRAAVPDLRLVCAGEGERAAVARHAERLGIGDAVKFTGAVGPSGKRALLESAAVLALPAYDEAVPACLLEAMAAGVPVLASAVGGIPEFVADGVSGFLIAPGDGASLERRLRALLLDPKLAQRIGAAGRRSVALRCAPERALGKLEALYASLGLAASDAHSPLAPAGLNEAA